MIFTRMHDTREHLQSQPLTKLTLLYKIFFHVKREGERLVPIVTMLTYAVLSCQSLELQLVHLGDGFQEGFPRGLTELDRLVLLYDPRQQSVVPTASVVVGVVPSNTGNQRRSKSKEPTDLIPFSGQ